MSKLAVCDNCGDRDDWATSKGHPFLYGGAVIGIRRGDGSEEPEHDLEICQGCVDKLLKKFPKLKMAISPEAPTTTTQPERQ